MNDKTRHNSPNGVQDRRIEPKLDQRSKLNSDVHAQSLSDSQNNETCADAVFDPSDQVHLMAFADGELQGEQYEQMHRHVQQNAHDEAVLQGIWQLGDWVRHSTSGDFWQVEQAGETEQAGRVWDDALGEQITSAVMRDIEGLESGIDASLPQVTNGSKENDSQQNALISLEHERRQRTAHRAQSRRKSATLLSVAAVLGAAAAGVMLLFRVGVFTPVHRAGDNAANKADSDNGTLAVSSVNTTQGTAENRRDSSRTDLADSLVDEELSPTVAVNAVDFGSRTGTVFYVPNDRGSTTTVVWVTDDELGGN